MVIRVKTLSLLRTRRCVRYTSETVTLSRNILTAIPGGNTRPINILFYVSGAIAHSTVGVTKCDSCREMLINSSELTAAPAIDLDEQRNQEASDFLDSINRGGLVKPIGFLYNFAVHCWRVFEELWKTQDLKAQFLQCSGQRNVFCKIMDRATYNEKYMHLMFGSNMCTVGHDLQSHIVRRFFNCYVAKNLVKQLTNTANQSDHGPSANKRKIAKLKSASH